MLAGAAVLVILPYGFGIDRAVQWQFAAQAAVERAAMAQVTIGTDAGPVRVTVGGNQARNEFGLQVAHRTYLNTNGLERDVGVGPVQVTGQIISSGRPTAWCFGHAWLRSPNKVADPRSFATAHAEGRTCHRARGLLWIGEQLPERPPGRSGVDRPGRSSGRPDPAGS